jgi:hypothetical protein
MKVREWSAFELDYGRRLLQSGMEGARTAEHAYLQGKSLSPLLGDYVKHALAPATIGACLGILGAYPEDGQRSRSRLFACGILGGAIGGAIGFGASLAWQTRRLARSITRGALRNVSRVRDEHWLEKHPIDYA